jgi:Tfp pilus assembly major pilin PilA
MKNKALLIAAAILFTACENGPKIIKASNEDKNSNSSSGIFNTSPTNEDSTYQNTTISDDLHTVVVNEILPTEKYMYLYVSEGGEKFWIATRTKDVKVGETYYYKGGLLKTNFESKEYNRVFEKVYLISNLVSTDHSNNASVKDITDYSKTKSQYTEPTKVDVETHTNKKVEHKGSIKIAELVKDPKRYAGTTIQLSGICTKINAGIMDRNWIHIKDGSKDDFDLVITSNTFIPEGKAITMKALVTLNKDFGAGYKYDLILENGTLVK